MAMAYNNHACATRSDGSLVSSGYDGQKRVSETPTGTGFMQAACGGYHSSAICEDGSLVTWGDNAYNNKVSDIPGGPGGSDFVSVAAGADFAGRLAPRC